MHISNLSTCTKFQWRNACRQAVNSYRSKKLREEVADKSTLVNCNLWEMAIGTSHIVWESVDNNTTDVKKGITKTRMLTGVYILQSTKARFNQYEVEQTCPLCRLATEDLQHILLRYPAFSDVRGPLLADIRKLLIRQLGLAWWSTFQSSDRCLVIGSTNLKCQTASSVENGLLGRLETLCRRFCHKLHMQMLQLHQKLLL